MRQKWAPTLNPSAPFSPISPSLTLMDPKINKFWSRLPYSSLPHTPPKTPPSEEIFITPENSIVDGNTMIVYGNGNSIYSTPILQTQLSNCSIVSDIFGTPDSALDNDDVFTSNVVELRKPNLEHNKLMSTITENITVENTFFVANTPIRSSLRETKSQVKNVFHDGVIRSKSDYEIPLKNKSQTFLQNIHEKTDHLFNNVALLSPLTKRRFQNSSKNEMGKQSTPIAKTGAIFKVPGSPILNQNNCGGRAISLNSLRHSAGDQTQQTNNQQLRFVLDGILYILLNVDNLNVCMYELRNLFVVHN